MPLVISERREATNISSKFTGSNCKISYKAKNRALVGLLIQFKQKLSISLSSQIVIDLNHWLKKLNHQLKNQIASLKN